MSDSTMVNFAVPPMEKIRIGFVGVGNRGFHAVKRIAKIPGVEFAAISDLQDENVEKAKQWSQEAKMPGALHTYGGKLDSWRGLINDDEVDVVYIASPAQFHAETIVEALKAGKHVLTEVPGTQTIDEAWEIVETCEKARRHCMMLENCCYGEMEMFAWKLAHDGLLGTLTHAEGGYIHNLVNRQLENHFRNRGLMEPGKIIHRHGNTYPTHPLGPICMYMDMNRGDRMERVVSMSSLSAAHTEYAKVKFGADEWQNKIDWRTGDVNTSIIRTARGRTIMLQVDMSTPRPYSRINLIEGTKGCFYDYPPRLLLSEVPGQVSEEIGGHGFWMNDEEFAKFKEEHSHPLWKRIGEMAKKNGGHGGMDFIMDLRWIYCLQNGLPLDMDVYDLASWSSIVPCSAESDLKGGEPIELPDFTRGGWKTAKPIEIGDIDLEKMGLA